MRLIDADKLTPDDFYDRINGDECMAVIDEQPTVNIWIPVSESLPNNYQSVIAQWEKSDRISNTILTFIDIMYIDSTGEWNSLHGIPNGKVVAWIPLPELYRDGEIDSKCGLGSDADE